MYLLRLVLYIMKAVSSQNSYWNGKINALRNEVINCDTCQRTKLLIAKYDKLTAKLADKISWNKLCVGLIGPNKICSKGKNNFTLKSIMIVNPVTGWFEIIQDNNKKSYKNCELGGSYLADLMVAYLTNAR